MIRKLLERSLGEMLRLVGFCKILGYFVSDLTVVVFLKI